MPLTADRCKADMGAPRSPTLGPSSQWAQSAAARGQKRCSPPRLPQSSSPSRERLISDPFAQETWFFESCSRQSTGSTMTSEADAQYSLMPGSPDPGRKRLESLTEQRGWRSFFRRLEFIFILGIVMGSLAMYFVLCITQSPSDGSISLTPARGERKLLQVLGRSVVVYRPDASGHLPVVIGLHGSEDEPHLFADATGLEHESAASEEPFLVAFPEMATPRGEAWGYEADDHFFRSLVEALSSVYDIKRDEVFVCGHSAGGSMSLYLQNNLRDVFSGAAAVEAGVPGNRTKWRNESFGLPTMVVWNHNDPVLKEYGGEQLYQDTVRMLRRHDSAEGGPSFKLPIHFRNSSAVRFAHHLMWGAAGSSPPTAVVSWESSSPTHEWSSNRSVAGSFDASTLVWEFFRATRVFYDRAHASEADSVHI